MRYCVLLLFIFTLVQSTFSQKNFSLLGQIDLVSSANDIWGYEHPDGTEYALVGTQDYTAIIDVEDPSNPVELFTILGKHTDWRDIKVWDNFAYVTNENSGGLLIIDLSHLPDSVPHARQNLVGPYDYQKAHNIFIDENGIAYICGSNIENKGVLMLDLNTTNRFVTDYLGLYDDFYVHDCYARGDTLYTSEILDGTFSVIDVSNKANPTVLASQTTSSAYTHNCWLSPDGNYLATTDERSGAFIDMYDVSDLSNITLLDKYQSSPEMGVIPHNTFFYGQNYLFTSYYRDGLTLVDATRRNNLVEVGYYDTSDFSSEDGYEGAWGVYPYLPSGNVLVTDRQEGLFILQPTFTRACYLEGVLQDSMSLWPVADVRVTILGQDAVKYSEYLGDYRIGVADPGLYDVKFEVPNCGTFVYPDILFEVGVVNTKHIKFLCNAVPINDSEGDEEITIYPNPITDNFTLAFSFETTLDRINVFSTDGCLIDSWEIGDSRGEVFFSSNWKPGVYVFEFDLNKQKVYRKIVKD